LLDRYLTPGATMAAALYSLPYSVAVALADGTYGLAQLDEARRNDTAILELARRATLIADPAMTRRYPETTPASVTVIYRDGQQITEAVEHPPGDPRRQAVDEDLSKKFDSLASPILGATQAQTLRLQLMAAEDIADISRPIQNITTLLNQP